MQVTFWGTRGSIAKAGPTTLRFGGNTSCVEVRSDAGTTVVIDCGTGAHALGQVYAAETGFHLARDPDTVRAPDVAFITAARVPHPEPEGFAQLAPDLVIEVLSPGDRPGETLAKVGDWLEAGSRLVWVIDPDRRLARVYRADGSQTQISSDGSLDGEDVMPGFSCRLGEIL